MTGFKKRHETWLRLWGEWVNHHDAATAEKLAADNHGRHLFGAGVFMAMIDAEKQAPHNIQPEKDSP